MRRDGKRSLKQISGGIEGGKDGVGHLGEAKLEVVDEPGGDRLARGDALEFDVCENWRMPPARSLTELAKRVGVAEAAAAAVVWPPPMCEGLIGRGHECSGVRSAIRLWLGFRRATEADATHLLAWLRREILPQDLDEAHIQESALASYRERQIEPPTSVSLRRFIWSALRAHEADFFAATFAQLSLTTLEAMEALLTPSPTSATGEPAAERCDGPPSLSPLVPPEKHPQPTRHRLGLSRSLARGRRFSHTTVRCRSCRKS
jgi:hypothetical protein